LLVRLRWKESLMMMMMMMMVCGTEQRHMFDMARKEASIAVSAV
jgi:hypothetical protein